MSNGQQHNTNGSSQDPRNNVTLPPIRTIFPGAFPPRSRTPAPPAPPPQGHYRTGPPPARSNTPGPIPPMPLGRPPVPPVLHRASTPASHMFTVMAPANGGGYATIARTTTEQPIGIIRRPHPDGGPVTAPREKRHVCNSCGAAFDRAAALENHIRTHTGERPFACVYCPQTFNTNGNLRRHMRDQHNA
ncbi:hypothetical protein EXIGLDRAFT_768424 [Exidia glandulosa HHB12029]|uniref:C2H2-type domain-containing protein n=1 Tax=Exidia glandulosa HHB12029 TaxID=1314781 RepID=A0A165I9N7_EXIGL|nr:hypothetical protein EXIGLDRAFT_768424 [Exidia glandulosa HHB12029]